MCVCDGIMLLSQHRHYRNNMCSAKVLSFIVANCLVSVEGKKHNC